MNWPYVAGFFDGEGSVVFTGDTCKITMSQNSRDVLEKIQAFLLDNGLSHCWIVTTPPRPWQRMPNTKYDLSFSNADNVRLFFNGVLPYCIVKRDKILEAIPRLSWNSQRRPTEEQYALATRLLKNGTPYVKVQEIVGIKFSFAKLKKLKES